MKAPSAKKKSAQTLEQILARVDADMATVVAAIDAEQRNKPPRRPHRHRRHEPAKAA